MKEIVIIRGDDADRRFLQVLLSGRYAVRAFGTVAEAAGAALPSGPRAIVVGSEDCSGGGTVDPIAACARVDAGAGVVCVSSSGGPEGASVPPGGEYRVLGRPLLAEALYAAVRLAVAESTLGVEARRRTAAGQAAAEAATAARIEAAPLSPFGRKLLGEGPAMCKVRERIELYAGNEAPVLIVGESGTGKELAAEAIHLGSRRSARRFLPIDCATLSESLAESTLFGSVKGAFTDAVDKRGAFESARGGTVFLDEIGELALTVQAKFLRTLESGSGSRVGSVDQRRYDVRIVSATNASSLGDARRFRPELFHRISTLVIEMPALRAHKEDLPLLVGALLAEYASEKHVTADTMAKLWGWDWPGNVRELRNVVRRAALLSGGRETILPADIEFDCGARPWQGCLF
ncbi:MAG TPA: sigma 54-interacting transcriptional regulator [Spirochaetales bacterium]|nr:sigma 54-interacting transcriptional regulator [Spirochaetales bacterium]HPB65783.1 sigma 54-interacting transcriptional regulator [Spirochaetales bacterium]HPG85908.1 sigma 54-interacting transcriptional regulator [Spirochaetales bacterium]HPM72114.1 sigma 54-interacting transcriptional regulator [Spirochaetales bacterium]